MLEFERPYRNILVATDFSKAAAAALETAAWTARRWQAKLTVVHVVRSVLDSIAVIGYGADWEPTLQDLTRLQKQLCDDAEERLETLLAPLRGGEYEIQGEVCVGRPFEEIVHVAEKRECDLVIAGTRGLSAVRRILVGSTATKLARVCPCPVWISRADHANGLRSILVPLDFSETSQKALAAGVDLALSTGAELHLLHAYDTEDLHGLLPQSEETKAELAYYRRRSRRAALEQLQQSLARVAGDRSIETTNHVAQGAAWKVISSAARRLNADLIVMGSVGRRGVSGLLIGNTAERVLHTADSSVLVVKPDEFETPVWHSAAAESRRQETHEKGHVEMAGGRH
ncbi:MAG TPA: universal stress protein [Pirellulales bacterium]|nr:universal stress protein [Pirellulales bacterium]